MVTIDQLQGVLNKIDQVRRDLSLSGTGVSDLIRQGWTIPAGGSETARTNVLDHLFRDAQGLADAVANLQAFIETMKAPGGNAATTEKPDGAARMSFGDALSGLGQAMVSAQRSLDEAAASYSRTAKPGTAPAMFRIPTMKAGFRFAVDRLDQTGFNLLIWSSSRNTREQNQQSVDVEIVAVPPDAAQQDRLTGLPAPAWFLTGYGERAPWLTADLLLRSQSSQFPQVKDRMVLIEQSSLAIEGARRVFAAVQLQTAGIAMAGAWSLTMGPDGNVRTDELLAFQNYTTSPAGRTPGGPEAIGLAFAPFCDLQGRQ